MDSTSRHTSKSKAIELLKQLIDEIPHLRTLNYENPELKPWLDRVKNILSLAFDDDDYQKFVNARLRSDMRLMGDEVHQSNYEDNLTTRKTILQSIIDKHALEEEIGQLQTGEDTKQLLEDKEDVIEPSTAKENWQAIENGLGVKKRSFGKKINFITDPFKRTIIFRDVEQAFVLASLGFSKPAVILAGSVIEELLRLYLEYKRIPPLSKTFDGYIRTCEENELLKDSVSSLSDAVRQFRNLVHLSAEETKKYTISKATAIGAVSSIFTIANDF